jgi:hypothetical protein
MLLLDDVPCARIGDEVVLGPPGRAVITAEEIGQAWGTVNYDVVCGSDRARAAYLSRRNLLRANYAKMNKRWVINDRILRRSTSFFNGFPPFFRQILYARGILDLKHSL